jgi:hypothetical protein
MFFQKNSNMIRKLIICSLFLVSINFISLHSKEVKPWELPALPSNPPPPKLGNTVTDKKIPKHLWMAVRVIEKELNYQLPSLFERNKGWDIHIVSNEMKDEFMNTTFANTSLLWAYHMIHPIAGAAKADLWRYAVLWTYGGAYIDDDSDIATPLDEVVQPDDTLIVAFEKNGFNANRCYIPKYHLSDFSAYRDESLRKQNIFGGRMLLNWAFLTSPRNILVEHIIKNSVEIIVEEYHRDSVLRSLHTSHAWEIIGCATGPTLFTATARELAFKHGKDFQYRLGGADFRDYGGRFKAVHMPVRNDPNHYMRNMNRHGGHTDLLVSYLTEKMPDESQLAVWQGLPIQGQNGKQIFLVEKGKRRGIHDWDTFVALNFTMADVIVISDAKIASIELGEAIKIAG